MTSARRIIWVSAILALCVHAALSIATGYFLHFQRARGVSPQSFWIYRDGGALRVWDDMPVWEHRVARIRVHFVRHRRGLIFDSFVRYEVVWSELHLEG